MSFKSKVENFFYHHKWKVIIGGAFAVFITIMIIQLFSRTEYDLMLLYAGPRALTPNEVRVTEQAFDKEMNEDYNGDGLMDAELYSLFLMTDEQIQASKDGTLTGQVQIPNTAIIYENRKTFNTQIMSGEALICILDPEEYKLVRENDGALPLSEIEGVDASASQDGFCINFCDTEFAKYYELDKIYPENTVICFRRMSSLSFLKLRSKEEERYEYNKRVFADILSFTHE